MPKLPVIGEVNKGTAIAGAAAAVAVGGYAWYKHEKTKAAASATPSSGSQNGTSANSQYGYGTYGYGTNNGYYGYGFPGSTYGYGIAADELAGQLAADNAYAYGYESQEASQATTNSQWTQAALTQLTGQGYNGETVLSALGQYLLGHQISQSQESIVQAAIAVEGYPPQAGTDGYPPAMRTSSGGGGGSNPAPKPSGNSILVPNITGRNKGDASNLIQAANLKPHDGNFRKGDATQVVTRQVPAAGASVKAGSQVTYYSSGNAKLPRIIHE
jgi:hypothetical protein